MVLVDTPGVGENDDMDKVIEKFVEENQVMGFVYIIKSDAGGGVDEDRVSGLLGWGEWFIEVGQVDY